MNDIELSSGRTKRERPSTVSPVGAQSFQANLMALEARMTRLALTRRLSDDCAFVINPYKQESK